MGFTICPLRLNLGLYKLTALVCIIRLYARSRGICIICAINFENAIVCFLLYILPLEALSAKLGSDMSTLSDVPLL